MAPASSVFEYLDHSSSATETLQSQNVCPLAVGALPRGKSAGAPEYWYVLLFGRACENPKSKRGNRLILGL
jgi:hypothetical protein